MVLAANWATESSSDDRGRTVGEAAARYRTAQNGRAAWQVANTFVPFFVIWALMAYGAARWPYFALLPLALLAAAFLLRVFGIQHDCGHGTFFTSKRANNCLGCLCSVFTLTPYYWWLRSHAYHHAHTGNLDYQETGYVRLKTVAEFQALGFGGKLGYRIYRNPYFLFLVGAPLKFAVLQRLTSGISPTWKKERLGVHATNAAILGVAAAAIAAVGWQTFLLVHLPIVWFTSILGVWIFYIQHTYEEAYFARGDRWDSVAANLDGCSVYDLPWVCHWFSFFNTIHHIHHLDCRVPSYRIGECYRENAIARQVKKISFGESLHCARLALWDEARGKMICFDELSPRSDA